MAPRHGASSPWRASTQPSDGGPGTDEQRPAGLSLHGMAGGLQGAEGHRGSTLPSGAEDADDGPSSKSANRLGCLGQRHGAAQAEAAPGAADLCLAAAAAAAEFQRLAAQLQAVQGSRTSKCFDSAASLCKDFEELHLGDLRGVEGLHAPREAPSAKSASLACTSNAEDHGRAESEGSYAARSGMPLSHVALLAFAGGGTERHQQGTAQVGQSRWPGTCLGREVAWALGTAAGHVGLADDHESSAVDRTPGHLHRQVTSAAGLFGAAEPRASVHFGGSSG
mmetsp:Transcript_39500/g.85242  ORF Transcript_39500/g.85242 Transcript_39500/m.85242 type:complete len:280 (-) Transcript_39500:380-1219(-)